MDIKQHKEEFDKIIKKYNLSEEDRATEIANFLTKGKSNLIDIKEFSILFGMSEEEAKTFLSFIVKGLEFKRNHIDRK